MSALHIDHLGIIVDDLEAAIERFRALFGEGPASTKDMEDVGIRTATFAAANIDMELIQYTGDGHAKEVMGAAPGLNHFSARVADMEDALGSLGASGFRVMEGFPREGVHGRVAFFEPDAATGVRFEISEAG